jgi:purine-nucleoside phosphorylase
MSSGKFESLKEKEVLMSIHIEAKPGEIAESVLLPGDPLRAQFIAETYLEKPICYNHVRNMLGFTGLYRGKRVSVQGTGMGTPSISIYLTELFRDYGVQHAIRIGTAGSLQEKVQIRDLVLALAASTNSGANSIRLGPGLHFAPAASFKLLKLAWETAQKKDFPVHAGTVASSDLFYTENPDEWRIWAQWGCLAVEMETAELYTLAAKYRREALAILTISDSMAGGEVTSAAERQSGFTRMMETALETISLI